MLICRNDDTVHCKDSIAIFGLGLIGSSILRFLKQGRYSRLTELPLSWVDKEVQSKQLDTIEKQFVRSVTDGSNTLQVIWAAGRAGFSASESEAASELASFQNVVRSILRVHEQHPEVRLHFHHVSSLGGLFEGQRHISAASEPSARRPYGRLKLNQERLVTGLGDGIRRTIYRVSSAIGPATGQQRMGLVARLISDAVNAETTTLVGKLTTLRDFVWHEDIGRHIASAAMGDDDWTDSTTTQTLASGKCSSIGEVIAILEGLLDRRLYVRGLASCTNDSDITVSKDILPESWQPTDLRYCVSRVYTDAIHAI